MKLTGFFATSRTLSQAVLMLLTAVSNVPFRLRMISLKRLKIGRMPFSQAHFPADTIPSQAGLMAFCQSHLPQPPTVFSPSTMRRKIGRRTFSHIHLAPAWMPAQAGLMALFHSHFAAAPIAWRSEEHT